MAEGIGIAGRSTLVAKRAMDIVLSAGGLLMLGIVIGVCALVIRAGSPGPAIFRQTRVGQRQRLFTCYKLRTMYEGTPHVPTHESSAATVTPMGLHLRRWKIDELPQLWNVLKGEMSLVGPRPCLRSQTRLIEARERRGVYALKPGITGVAQVAGVDMSDPERLAALDATYFRLMSPWADIRLIMATFVPSGRHRRAGPVA